MSTAKSQQTSQVLAQAMLKVWTGLAAAMVTSDGACEIKHHVEAMNYLTQIQSVCDFLGGHAKVKKRCSDIKTCSTATQALASSIKHVQANYTKDPEKKLKPALMRAMESVDKRPKHLTEDDLGLEDAEFKAFERAYTKMASQADDIIIGNSDIMNRSATKLYSLLLDKVDQVVQLISETAGGSKDKVAGSCWFDGYGDVLRKDKSKTTPKQKLMSYFSKTLGAMGEKDVATMESHITSAAQVHSC
jgi:hypothetical protein